MLKIISINVKVLELAYFKILLQNTTDDCSLQNFQFNYDVEKAKIAIFNNAVIWTNKIIGSVKSPLGDDSHKDKERRVQISELLDHHGRNIGEYNRIRMRAGVYREKY